MNTKWKVVDVTPKLKGAIAVKCLAHIRNNATGEVRTSETVELLEDGEAVPMTYIWREGNFRCDCNRSLFFRRHDEPEPDHDQCGEGGYSVNVENPVTGEIYYREFEL